ncbi:MAG TPA: cytochrome c biogenesis protein CcdA [Thermoleophilaceae bacterium]|jgi:cytochrome c-type biogenesis protein|nr:cytochrome c biogenesis protein CcdA [Thermoleophilaceae bacterium]
MLDVLAVAADNSVDTTVFAAFGVGFLSFVSPCVLPLVPGYLSAVSGVSYAELAAGQSRWKVLGPAILFCLSFTAMFVALGMTATGLGQTLQEHRAVMRQISGVVIAALGVFFVATLFIPAFNREFRPQKLLQKASSGGPIIAGLAFAVAWLPCTGPTLGVILTAASNQNTVGKGAGLLAVYSLGLAVPFILCALAMASMTRFFRFFRNHFRVITFAAGAILVVMGVMLYTNDLTRLNTWANDLGLNLISGV